MTATETADEESWTIGRVLRWTQQKFAARNIGSPRLDAELLLAHAVAGTLGGSRVALYTHFDKVLEQEALGRYRELIKRRLAGTPVAYLTGEKEFFGLPLKVSEAVLIPRPETELLVELALKFLPQTAAAAPSSQPEIALSESRAEPGVELRVDYDEPVDEPIETEEAETATAEEPAKPAPAATIVGTAGTAETTPIEIVATVVEVGVGSGAVSLAIAHKRRDVKVIAIDKSPEALAVATENAQRLSLPVEFHRGDLLSPLTPAGRIDVIVANLPYIPTAEIAKLAPEVRSEPHQALDGGPDGLVIIRRLVSQATAHLRPGGALLLEVGDGQAPDVEKLLTAAGFVDVRSECDLAQIARVVLGRRPR